MTQPVSLFDVLERTVSRHPDAVAFPRWSASDERPTTYAKLLELTRAFGAALLASGVQPGERVMLLSESMFPWILSDLGTLSIGAVDVPQGEEVSPQDLAYILHHSDAHVVLVGSARAARTLERALSGGPKVKLVVGLGVEPPAAPGADALTLDALLERGARFLATRRAALDEAVAAVRPESLATIVYTSGTTGIPKGVMLTHGNLLQNIRVVPHLLELGPGDVFLSFLPTWHTFERMLEYVAISVGASTVYTSKKDLKEDLRRVRPTVMGSVPRVWEVLFETIRDRVRERPAVARRLLAAATTVGWWRLKAGLFARGLTVEFREPPLPLRALRRAAGALGRLGLALPHAPLDALCLRPIRELLGGRLRAAISGGSSLPFHVDRFFNSVGVPLLNGYGLTETAPVLAVRFPARNVPGTIGPPIPDTEIKIAREDGAAVPDGEIALVWARGPQVMQGYYKSPELTGRVLLRDGWFNTGDLGRRSVHGEVMITGRAKETIVLRGGENVEPRPLEDRLLLSPFIDQVVVVGQDQKTLGALIVPAFTRVRELLGLPAALAPVELIARAEVQSLFAQELNLRLTEPRTFRPFEIVRKFRLLSNEFSIEDETLTRTLKVRRIAVTRKYRSEIEAMFDGTCYDAPAGAP
jgi:long-chain acyl-CoA synthetase